MSELAALRTAKAALDEGLISDSDFDVVKVGFLKAQQIKAGLDAGFIREDDFKLARETFFQSLDMGTPGHAQASPAAASVPAPPPRQNLQRRGSNNTPSNQAASKGQTSPQGSTPVSAKTPFATASRSAPPPPPPPATNGPPKNNMLPRSNSLTDSRSIKTSGKVSLSGIAVDENAVQEYQLMKGRKTYSWMTFKINDDGTTVILADTGGPGSEFEDFVASLPETECRYGVFDYHYEANDNRSFDKLVFINWAPANSTIKQKMMMASTKDFFKGFLEGIQIERQAAEYDEITKEDINESIKSSLTRK